MHMITISDSLIYSIAKKDIETELKEARTHIRVDVPTWEDLTIERDFEDIQEIVEYFARVFQVTFTEEETRQMLHRLKSLIIERKEASIQKLQKYVSLGGYNAYYNKMVIRNYPQDFIKALLKDTIIHELIHMASTRSTNKGQLTGFEIGLEIGKTLNEGYTEYLREKYFREEKGKYIESKDWRIVIVKAIEYMVGEKEMEHLFLNANLPGLLKVLGKYASEEDLIKFIFLLDRVETNIGFSRKKYDMLLKQLAKMNERKLKMDLEQKQITPTEYDLLRALKVEEVRKGRIWSEEAKFFVEDNCFLIGEQGYQSSLYELKSPSDEKSERINSQNRLIIIK